MLNLGHTPDAVVAAIKQQADALLHCLLPGGRLRALPGGVPAAVRARRRATFDKKAVLINSGAEAVENAVKIARYHTGRDAVITFDRGFHGRTLLTMTLTSKLVYKKGMGPFAPEVYRAPAPYPYRGISTEDALAGLDFMFKATVDPQSVACVILEPVQGEGGFTVMPPEFIQGLKERCERYGILYIDDEVQSGMGRTGTLWGIEHSGVVPDLMTVGKSLASGMPLAGVVGRAEVIDSVHLGGLGSTYGGNPVACAAADREHQGDRRPGVPGAVACAWASTSRPGCARWRRRHPGDRRGARHRADGGHRACHRPRDAGAGRRHRRRDGGGRAGAGSAPAEDRHLRQRPPHARPDQRNR